MKLLEKADITITDQNILSFYLNKKMKELKTTKRINDFFIEEDKYHDNKFIIIARVNVPGDNWSGDWFEDKFVLGKLDKSDAELALNILKKTYKEKPYISLHPTI